MGHKHIKKSSMSLGRCKVNHSEILPHTYQWQKQKVVTTPNAGNTEKLDHLHTARGNVK